MIDKVTWHSYAKGYLSLRLSRSDLRVGGGWKGGGKNPYKGDRLIIVPFIGSIDFWNPFYGVKI